MKTVLLSLFLGAATFGFSQNLIGHYKFDFTNDTLDYSASGNHLETFSSGTSYEFVSQNGTGIHSDTCVHFQAGLGLKSTNTFNNAGATGGAVAFWIKEGFDNSGYVIQSGTGFGVQLSGGMVRCFFDGSAANSLVADSSILGGEWHHIVCQNNGTVTSIYFDGLLTNSQPETMFIQNSLVHFYLGSSSSNGEKIDAYLDDLRIYDDTLSQSQIDDLVSPSTASLHEGEQLPSIRIFPNPANEFIHLNSEVEIQELFVFDALGQKVITITHPESTLNLSHLPRGVYSIRFLHEGGETTQRFVKQ